MSFALFLARTSKGHSLIYKAVVADLGSFPYYNSHTVIYKKSFSDFSSRMNFYSCPESCKLRNDSGYCKHLFLIEPVSPSVTVNSMKSRIGQPYFKRTSCRRITFFYESNVFSQLFKQYLIAPSVFYRIKKASCPQRSRGG